MQPTPEQPTIRVETLPTGEDWTVPEGYQLRELRAADAEGSQINWYAVLIKNPKNPPKPPVIETPKKKSFLSKPEK